jgi:hypothetical protein
VQLRLSYQQLKPDDQWGVPWGINLQLKDTGKWNFVETTACSDILKLFGETLEPAQSCSVNS